MAPHGTSPLSSAEPISLSLSRSQRAGDGIVQQR